MITNLSPHFSLQELSFSQKALRLGIDNTPNNEQVTNLARLCAMLLEPARAILGIPLHVDSGFRSPAVNADVGGDLHSAHMDGRAADVIPIGMPILQAFDLLHRNNSLPYDRMIFECQAWIHLAIAPLDAEPRRIAELASGHPGAWTYTLA